MERVLSLKGLKFREYDLVWEVIEDTIGKDILQDIVKGFRLINEVPSVFIISPDMIEVENQDGKIYKFHKNGLCF